MDDDYEQDYEYEDEPKHGNRDQASSPVNRDLNNSKTQSKVGSEDFYKNDMTSHNIGSHIGTYDTTDVEALISINDNLKSELETIVKTIETQYAKMKEDRRSELEAMKQRMDDDEEVRAKEQNLRLSQGKVNKMKKEISWMKQQINNAYEVDNILALENELTYNRQVIDKLMAHNKGLVNVKKGQSVAMRKLNHDVDANQRLEGVKQEVEEYKRDVRAKAEQIRVKDKELQEKQKRMVDLEDKYRKLQFLLKNKKGPKEAIETGMSAINLTYDPVLDGIKENSEELAQKKYEEEAKYNKLFQNFEASIKNLEEDLLSKQTQLRDESRMVQHNKRVEQLNTFYKKKKFRDEKLRKLEEKKLKEFNDKLKGRYRPHTEDTASNNNKLHEPRDHIIVEERSKVSDESRTQDFYHASSDEEDTHKKIKSPSPRLKEHKNKDIEEDSSHKVNHIVKNLDNEVEEHKKNKVQKEEKFEIQLSGNNISTVPVANNKIPEIKKKEVDAHLNQDIVQKDEEGKHANKQSEEISVEQAPSAIPPKRSMITKPGFALKK